MIIIKIILLLGLAAYVACGGGEVPPTIGGITLKFPDDDDNGTHLIQTGEPSEPLDENKKDIPTVSSDDDDNGASLIDDNESFQFNNLQNINTGIEDEPISEEHNPYLDDNVTYTVSNTGGTQILNQGNGRVNTYYKRNNKEEPINVNIQQDGASSSGLHSSKFYNSVQINNTDGITLKFPDDDDNGTHLIQTGEPSEPLDENKKDIPIVSSDDDDNGASLIDDNESFQFNNLQNINTGIEDQPISEEHNPYLDDNVTYRVSNTGGTQILNQGNGRVNTYYKRNNKEEPINVNIQEDGASSSGLHSSKFYNSVQINNTGTQSFQTKSREQEPTNANIQRPRANRSRLGSSRSAIPRSWTMTTDNNESFQFNNFGNVNGNINVHINGSPLDFQGDTLFIGDIEVEGVNATVRPLVIVWGNSALSVNGIGQPAFTGILGSGTLVF
ncbi:uncharacterized protein LOC126837964 isoform X2 [Adelges cooleyi]|uniref:uncharacterized protein LOC126837964 isoform X2 n=1 Tax=Adelges cooleyi TaxID=133065 RepID=UPI00217FBCC7|nr:uncharacterized protein LOC126837964 isoform X2 [Adelges cooleyi]